MTFDWSMYTGNIKWLRERTIYITRHGSHAYGTALPTSDLDLRGVVVAPLRFYLGASEMFEHVVQNSPDLTIFDIRKFCHLAADANPNTLEILFTDESDHVLVHPVARLLFEARDAFLSRKVKHTFAGYSRAQMKRINAHYRWLKNPPTAAPTRAEFNLPERTVIPADQLMAAQSAIQKQVDDWSWHGLEAVDPATRQALQDEFTRRLLEITQWGWDEIGERTWTAAARAVGYDENFVRLLDLERRYTARMREWQSYQSWLRTRNPARAALEAKWGYDTKHAMHLVRLARMCREILVDGTVRVRRPDAEELLAIRAGAWSYEDLVAFSDNLDAELDVVSAKSPLPKTPDRARIDAACMEAIKRMPDA